jgi:hypothetical protein
VGGDSKPILFENHLNKPLKKKSLALLDSLSGLDDREPRVAVHFGISIKCPDYHITVTK